MQVTEEAEKQKTSLHGITEPIELVFYTDPLCCWSWAMHKELEKLISELGDTITVRYCMGGLLSDWEHYHDTVNSISRPLQMGPLWMEVRHRTGAQLEDRIWFTDPPASSYPACIAVKCAGMQGDDTGIQMYRLLQQAIMTEVKNIAKTEVILEIAGRVNGLDKHAFEASLLDGSGIPHFRKDLEEVRLLGIERFPALKISSQGRSLMITGYRNYDTLAAGIRKLISR
ncbi:MAG: DsbA family protein [Sphingobacteriales bacterium]|nr:MAG: DsbA family protein [Sphingobacteriales bacterium]